MTYPGRFFLAPASSNVAEFLLARGWLRDGEAVQEARRAGEGNMNCVVRVRTSARTFILKQSRPWVEKYPSIAAPWDRALGEAHFYRQVSASAAVAAGMPRLLEFDAEERLLMLEDLGEAQDFTFLYGADSVGLAEAEEQRLIDFLTALHGSFRSAELASSFSNLAMRELNHEHIFALPIRSGNGLDLDAITPGLGAVARELSGDGDYCRTVRRLGERYLDQTCGVCLIHGDFFPGSWMKSGGRVFVIDPEFSFYGLPEWDLGVMAAHLLFSGGTVDRALGLYGERSAFDRGLVMQFAGVELMRRLIGVAQLPLACELARKTELLRLSRDLVLSRRTASG